MTTTTTTTRSNDFETHPVGTADELQRLRKQRDELVVTLKAIASIIALRYQNLGDQ